MAVELSGAFDLIQTTQRRLSKRFTSTQYYQDHPLVRFFMKHKEEVSGGTGYERRLRLRDAATFRLRGIYDARTTFNQQSLMATAKCDDFVWDAYMVFNEIEDVTNRGEAQIVATIKARREGAWADIYKSIENLAAQMASSSAAARKCLGIFYHARTLAVGVTDAVGDFNGTTAIYQDGSTETLWKGIDRANPLNVNTRNWVATYSNVDSVLIKTTRRGLKRTGFRSIPSNVFGDQPEGPDASTMLFMPQPVHDELEDRVNKGPDDLQGDEARFKTPSIRGVPLIPTPVFDYLSFAPIVGMRGGNNKIRLQCQKGCWMEEGKIIPDPGDPLTGRQLVYGKGQIVCDDPRSSVFVIHKAR